MDINKKRDYYFNKNKNRIIKKILSGSSTRICTIKEWNITWSDLDATQNDMSKINDIVKNYLKPLSESNDKVTPTDQNLTDKETIKHLREKIIYHENNMCANAEKDHTVYFNKSINLYEIKKNLYGVEKAKDYIGNLLHNATKFNKLNWINDTATLFRVTVLDNKKINKSYYIK
jgi:hypothetical protein